MQSNEYTYRVLFVHVSHLQAREYIDTRHSVLTK